MDKLIAGVLLGFLVGQLKLYFENRQKAKSLASAFHGEIKAVLAIALKEENLTFLKSLEESFEANEVGGFHIGFKKEYFTVYESNASSLGLLKAPNPELISTFYIYAKAILDEYEALDVLLESVEPIGLSNSVQRINETFLEAGRVGHRCVAQLESDYKLKS